MRKVVQFGEGERRQFSVLLEKKKIRKKEIGTLKLKCDKENMFNNTFLKKKKKKKEQNLNMNNFEKKAKMLVGPFRNASNLKIEDYYRFCFVCLVTWKR